MSVGPGGLTGPRVPSLGTVVSALTLRVFDGEVSGVGLQSAQNRAPRSTQSPLVDGPLTT